MKPEEGRYAKRTMPQMQMFDDDDEEVSYPQETTPDWAEQAEGPAVRPMGRDEEIMPGLYQSDIDSWKKQFPGVYHADIKGRDFIYRQLSRFEYKEIIAQPNTDPLMREEMICEYCVLYPIDYDFTKMGDDAAGYPALLSETIMDTSGFTRDIRITKL